MRLYATPDDLADDVPDEQRASLLRIASRMVDKLLTGRGYATDNDGLPTDPDVAEALQDATVAIVSELAATGATAAGSTTEWNAVSIGGVSLSGRTTGEAALTVMGLPVPAAAIVALESVGPLQLTVSGAECGRPLGRVATERLTGVYQLVSEPGVSPKLVPVQS